MRLELVLLGDPVDHSLSPALHNAALSALELEGRYRARRVDEPGMRAAADEMHRGRLGGANITMPHKRLAAALSDDLDPEAGRAGSVNTWVPRRDSILGLSTDISGMRRLWGERGLPEGRVVVLGSGGAAAAALVALAGRSLAVAARRPERAAALLSDLGLDARVVDWGAPVEGAAVVNATPLGMRGESLPDAVIDTAGGIYDLVYGRVATPMIEAARQRGIASVDGIDHLVAQAEESFRLWTGQRPPAGLMAEVARKASSTPVPEPKPDSEADG